MKNLTNLLRIASLLLLLASCLVEEQNFEKGTQAYQLANPPALQISDTKKSVTVAVIDSGVDYNHPRFEGLIQKNKSDKISGDQSESEGVGFDVLGKDPFPYPIVLDRKTLEEVDSMISSTEHGTHVAGIATLNGLLKSNTLGTFKFHDRVRLLPIRILPLGLSEEDVKELESIKADLLSEDYQIKVQNLTLKVLTKYMLESIKHIDSQNADVANFSLGIDGNATKPDKKSSELLEEFRLKVGEKIQNSPALYVFAAGNEAVKVNDFYFPAAFKFSNTITVGALKTKNEISWFSNFGDKVDVYVRGSDVRSAVPNNGVNTFSGTSMATPFVANLAAKVKMLCPSLSAKELKEVLLNTSLDKKLPVEPKEDAAQDAPIEYRNVRVLSFSKALKWAKTCGIKN